MVPRCFCLNVAALAPILIKKVLTGDVTMLNAMTSERIDELQGDASSDASDTNNKVALQALWFFLHALFCVVAWGAMMAIISLFHPENVPASITLAASFVWPLVAGFLLVKARPSDVASLIWLAGLVWFMIVGLMVLDMPTGIGACYHCGATRKVVLTFLSLNRDSGMLDGQGRFLGTWPTAATIGYSIGARVAMHGKILPRRP
jgi:hypothetical protein